MIFVLVFISSASITEVLSISNFSLHVCLVGQLCLTLRCHGL